mmetsp:Transcript_45620/g.117905  ORF Transcript_45620/g.117905 Transcript_45620/m.117905 type:complete len:127 (+) Transcript_45620:1072-1452(+)
MKLRGGIAQDAEQQKSYDPTNVKRSKSQGAEGGGEEKIDEPINTSSGKETGREASNTKTEKPKSIKKYDVNAREFKPREKPNLNQVHGQFPYQVCEIYLSLFYIGLTFESMLHRTKGFLPLTCISG